MIEVVCLNNNRKVNVSIGTTLNQLALQLDIKTTFPILGAMVNNKLKDVNYTIHKPSTIEYFDISSKYGIQMYINSLSFVLYKAVKELHPECELQILMPVSKGRYCEIKGLEGDLTPESVAAIKQKMREIIDAAMPITRTEMTSEDALALLLKHQLNVHAELIKERKTLYCSIYAIGDTFLYFPFYLTHSTGVLHLFDLMPYKNGMLLQYPTQHNPAEIPQLIKMEKLFSVLKEYKSWVKLLEVPNVRDLNKKVEENKINTFIRMSEALHEKRLAQVADRIAQKETVKIVLLSGPSSSGKTTTCKRLSVQLGVLGYHPVEISMDNFFVERDDTPKDSEGNYDFEDLHALDLDLFNQTLKSLLNGETVSMPTFNFQAGKKEWKDDNTLKMESNSLLVIEGIHALNPELIANIEDKYKFKIFVSALIPIALDALNPLSSTDNRLLRRIVRDHNYRGYSALETLKRWKSVRAGEDKNILPYQGHADEMFNSALLCEYGVMKCFLDPILNEVPINEPEYADAQRLLKLLSFFKQIPLGEVPSLSILREFLGGSHFVY